ncbi:polypyrimidine tract-binding protein homolog 3-like [Magnolia sinica]|uniref:polypyrimidine tract-binding protein homolog 3-like n=1 Tax=Magnolia sinica TaxID=86752 RepID=UPI00265ACCA2|nr:polypyrimidine tract-binding protein homolog 3-like [Magnolia sinica]
MIEPSKVIHVRNVGHEISESDLLQLVHPFGVVTKLVMLRAKDQPLLQMQDMASAINATGFRYLVPNGPKCTGFLYRCFICMLLEPF